MHLPRPSLAGALLALAAFLAGAIAFLLATGSRLPELDRTRLESARKHWRAAALQEYRMTLEIEGAELARGEYTIEVAAGALTLATRDGIAIGTAGSAYTVEGLLDTLERELHLAENPQAQLGAPAGYRAWLQAELDPALGLPRRFRRVVGGGRGNWVEWRVSSFEAR